MQFSDVVKTVTREGIVPKCIDTILKGNVAVLRTLGNAIPWGSGYQKEIIVKYQKSTVGGMVGVGGSLSTERMNTRVRLIFYPKRRHMPVVVDDIETTLNSGEEQIIDLLALEMDSCAQDLLDSIGTDLYTGSGAGEVFDSLVNAADDSSAYSTYGTRARATYTSIKGYLATSIGTLALSDMSTFHNAIKIGSDKPDVIFADTTSWTAYEGLLTPVVTAGYQTNGYPQVTRTGQVASQRALGGDIGFDSIFYRGTPIVEDEKCTSGNMYGINEKYFNFYGIDIKGYEKINIKNNVEGPQALPVPKGFNWTGLMRSTTQPAEVGHMYIIGDFISGNPRFCGRMSGITG